MKTGERFQICDECEAAWRLGEKPAARSFLQLFELFAERGLPDLWDKLEDVQDQEGEV